MLTAYADEASVARAVDAGVFAYVVKPFREQDLIPAIRTAQARYEELLDAADAVRLGRRGARGAEVGRGGEVAADAQGRALGRRGVHAAAEREQALGPAARSDRRRGRRGVLEAARAQPPATAGRRITVVPSLDLRVEAVEEAHVGAVDEDVQELRQLVAVVDAVARAPGRWRPGRRAPRARSAPGISTLRFPPASGRRIGWDADRSPRPRKLTATRYAGCASRAAGPRCGRSSRAPGRSFVPAAPRGRS